MKTQKEKTDLEELDVDYELIPNEDWKSLKKTRRVKADAFPNDMHIQCLYAEALIFNDEFEKAITFLTKLHTTEPQNSDIKNGNFDIEYQNSDIKHMNSDINYGDSYLLPGIPITRWSDL